MNASVVGGRGGEAELGDDVADVRLHGVWCYVETLGDAAVGETFGHERASLGDEQVLKGTIEQDGKAAGSFGVACTWVAVRVKQIRERCDGWGALNRGNLSFSGMSRFESNNQTWAITGGTGIYQTARGQIELHQTNDHVTLVTVTLISDRG